MTIKGLWAKNSPTSKGGSRVAAAPPIHTYSTTIDFSAASTKFDQQQVQHQQLYSSSSTDLQSVDEFKLSDFLNNQIFFPSTTTTTTPEQPNLFPSYDCYCWYYYYYYLQ